MTTTYLRSLNDLTDGEVIAILRGMDPRGGTAPFTPEEKRQMYRTAATRSGAPLEMERVVDSRTEGRIPIRTYSPHGGGSESRTKVLYLHGGGFLSGDLDTHDPICRLLAHKTGFEVTAVQYRLAPEFPYPAAVEDCYSVLLQLVAERSPVAVVGDSAGGNLAAVCCLMAREESVPVAAQALLYPMMDALMSSESLVQNAFIPPFTLADCVKAWQLYLPDAMSRADARVSPLHAPDLHGLPRTLVVTAEFDILRDDGIRFVQRLRDAGVSVEHAHYKDMVHGFVQWAGQVSAARACLETLVSFLRA